jgi:fucose permease
MKRFRTLLLIFACYYHYFLIGCFIAIRGFLLPQIKDDFNINYTISGLMILITAIPGFFVSLFSGHIFSIYNKKIILFISSGIVFIFFLFIPASNSYALFLILNLFMGLGSSMLVTGVNISVIDTFESMNPKYRDNVTILLHFIYSLGSSLVILLSGSLLKNNIGWRTIYLIVGIAFAITPVILIFSKYPQVKQRKTPEKKFNLNGFFALLFKRKMIFYSICIFFYGGLEFCLIIWIPTFLEKGFNLGVSYSSMTLTVFFLLFCIGRLLGGLVIHKLDKMKFLIVVLSLSFICLIAGLLFRIRLQNIDILISISGFFFSAVFPTIQNLVTADFKKDLSAATGIFLVANSSGTSILPFSIGVLNDVFTPGYGILFICTFYFVIIPLLIMAVKSKNPD